MGRRRLTDQSIQPAQKDSAVEPLPEVDPWRSPWPDELPTKPGRDANGRLLPGHNATPGAGRPPQSYLDKLASLKFTSLELLTGELTTDKLTEIFKHMVEKASKGDKWAIEWITKWIEPTPNTGISARLTPGGIIIEPIDDYRKGLAALAPPDDDEYTES